MPARFVEVTNIAESALSRQALLPNFSWNTTWFTNNGTSIATALGVAAQTESATARLMLTVASVLFVLHWLIVRKETQRALAEFGHAHAD